MKWFRKKAEALPSLPVVGDWHPSDRDNLNRFLESRTGKKLIERGRAVEYATSVAACADKISQGHSAPRAAGFSDCLNWLLSLSVAASAKPQIDSRAQGDAQPIESELDEYLARHSP